MLVTINDDAKLSPPIPEMIVGEDVMPQERERSRERVANHGTADMTNMHRFGNVGRRKVDDDFAFRIGKRDQATLVGEHVTQ